MESSLYGGAFRLQAFNNTLSFLACLRARHELRHQPMESLCLLCKSKTCVNGAMAIISESQPSDDQARFSESDLPRFGILILECLALSPTPIMKSFCLRP